MGPFGLGQNGRGGNGSEAEGVFSAFLKRESSIWMSQGDPNVKCITIILNIILYKSSMTI